MTLIQNPWRILHFPCAKTQKMEVISFLDAIASLLSTEECLLYPVPIVENIISYTQYCHDGNIATW